MAASPTIARWHQIARAKDTAGLDAILADDAVFESPVVHPPQLGKAITFKYLSAALHVLNAAALGLSAANGCPKGLRQLSGRRAAGGSGGDGAKQPPHTTGTTKKANLTRKNGQIGL